jgi:predicted nucleic acid-binding protein
MSRPRLTAALAGVSRIAVDTSVFIYQIEGASKYAGLAATVFERLDAPGVRSATATVTMLELLVQPYRRQDLDLVNRFFALLSTYPRLEWIAPSLEIADCAARLRAEHGLRTPDAIQAATALLWQADAFVSNDAVFRKLPGLDVVLLDDFLP